MIFSQRLMSFLNSNHWNRSWVRVNRKLLFGANLGVEVESTGFGKVLIPSSPNSYPGSKNMFIQKEQKIEEEVMKFGSKEGSLYPIWCTAQTARFYHHGWEGLLLGKCLVPDLLLLRLWEDERFNLSLNLVPITSCLSWVWIILGLSISKWTAKISSSWRCRFSGRHYCIFFFK